MEQVLTAFAGNDILTEASAAERLRAAIEERLAHSAEIVVLDFTGINGVSSDFVDALLGPLFELLGDTLPERVLLDNCSASVLNDFKCVAETGRSAKFTAGARGLGRRGRQAA